MDKRRSIAIALTLAGALASQAALAAQPTEGDFATCNREAQMQANAPSASPGATGSGAPATESERSQSPSDTTSPAGKVTGNAGSETSPGGSSGVAGGLSRSEGTSGSMSGARPGSDQQALAGISEQGPNDQAYRQAYLDCMRRRGF